MQVAGPNSPSYLRRSLSCGETRSRSAGQAIMSGPGTSRNASATAKRELALKAGGGCQIVLSTYASCSSVIEEIAVALRLGFVAMVSNFRKFNS